VRVVIVSWLVCFTYAPAAAGRRRSGPPPPATLFLSVGAAEVRAADLRFSGQPTLNGQPITVELKGSQLGLARPRLLDVALHAAYVIHHIALGGSFGALLNGHPQGAVDAPASLNGTLGGFYVGPEIATVWSWKSLEARTGFTFGYESLSFPLYGFDEVTCGKNGQRCQPSIGTERFFLHATTSLVVHVGPVALGTYAGGELVIGRGWLAGGLVGLATDAWQQRASYGAR
jgi:hypothetical protein